MYNAKIFLNFVRLWEFKDVLAWQFLTMEAAETLCMVVVPPEERTFRKNIGVIDLSKIHIL